MKDLRIQCIVALLMAVLCSNSEIRADDPPKESLANPPQLLLAAGIDESNRLTLVSYRTIYIGFNGDSYNSRSSQRVSLKGVTITQADGKKVSIDEARRRLAGKDVPILATSWKAQMGPFQTLLAKDSLVFAFPKEAPKWKEIQDPSQPIN